MTRQEYAAVMSSPCGVLGLVCNHNELRQIHFLSSSPLFKPRSGFAREVVRQLQEYFENPDFCFNLPLADSDTAYQRRVREGLLAVPVGETLSYGQFARQINTGARAVANACRRNPFPIVVPCHRIVAKDDIGGYVGEVSGAAVDTKRWLLRHERNIKS